MSAPVRKKRNFKSLALNVDPPNVSDASGATNTPEVPSNSRLPQAKAVATRPAPAAPAKRKPPAMDLSKSKTDVVDVTPARASSPLLALSTPKSASISTSSPSRSSYHSLQERLATMDIGGSSDSSVDLRAEDFRSLVELGHGNGGTVSKVEHVPTKRVMAKKVVLIDAKPAVRKQILRELQIMHDCDSPHIISFYGAFVSEPHICICMEFMDRGSLDSVYKKNGPIPIVVVGEVCLAVLEGLTYLYDVHRIIHRDIKPSNILLNSHGQIKLCDFGVSGELINSIADTFVGTSTYMSPERIQGAQYTVKSDVWSLGVTLIEIALGHFPFSDSDDYGDDVEGTLSPHESFDPTVHPGRPMSLQPLPRASTLPPPNDSEARRQRRKSRGVSLEGGGMTMSILELLQHIVNEPAPRLSPTERYPLESQEFVALCLQKDPDLRPTPKGLMEHPWMIAALASNQVNLEAWAATI